MFKRIVRRTKYIVFLLLFGFLLAGCEDKDIVITTEFRDGELMRINDLSCYKPEMMLYLTTIQNQYEAVYGEELWEKAVDGQMLSERIKETVLAQVAQVKVMNLMAKEYGISLDEEETAKINEAANVFFESLNAKEIEVTGASLDTVIQIYTEYAIANKVYEYTIKDINPEISDDEARTVTVQHILIKTYAVNADGKRMEYTDRAKEAAKELAEELRERASREENPEDFESLSAEYNEDDTMTYTFGRGEMAEAFEEAAFSLDKDEISEVIETEMGYHIIKCISTIDVEQTQENKLIILQERKDEAFEEVYESFVGTIKKNLNHELFESITLPKDPEVNTSNLFDVDF